MKVFFHDDFYQDYSGDPASEPGRMEAMVNAVQDHVELVSIQPATLQDIAFVHGAAHIDQVRGEGLYDIAALAAGGAVMAAEEGLKSPAFALIRPPGHHASADSCWGFCYFNNMAVALCSLKNRGLIRSAFVLDIDLHRGDGTLNILGSEPWVTIHNPEDHNRESYLTNVGKRLTDTRVDMIGISAGFDHHIEDWGGLLTTEDYYTLGAMVQHTARKNNGGCFAILEGGYNHDVLGQNLQALLKGLSETTS